MKAGLALLTAAVALLTSACGSVQSPDPEPNLFGEYLRSGDVKNDRFPGGGSGDDRLANFAAHYSADELHSLVLSAFPCEAGAKPPLACAEPDPVRQAATGKLYGRSIIVKHDDASLELLMLYVADGTLIDATGQTYRDLDDFLANNDVLSSDDVIHAPAEITSVKGGSKLVTVYGQTIVRWEPWVLGAVGVLIVLGGGLVVRRHMSARRRQLTEPTDPEE